MNIYKWKELDEKTKGKILKRAETDITEQLKVAQEIINDVKTQGDKAVCYYTEKFDGAKLSPETLKVTEEEINAGYERISKEFKETLEFAATNIKKFHTHQMPEPLWFTETVPGVMVGEQTSPISDVCLYVPRGKGSFPSVLLMLAIPAIVAQVPRIVIVTPPNSIGSLDDSVLAAAKVAGVKEIYKVGGIQAVAAIAYGTETIPACSKIIGPGNSYVTAAKRLLSGVLDVGPPAGPSEAIILADETADAKKVALDLMIEAEHGPDSASLLVTHVESLVEEVKQIIEKQLVKLSDQRKNFVNNVFNGYGGVIVTENLEQSIDFVNMYGPEHMEIMTSDPWAVLPKIKNAGEILLGNNAPITLANFLLGPNAILPTGGFAKTYSSVSVFDFLKRSSVGYVTEQGYKRVRDKAALFAREEGFETHALAVENR
ncbi:MAG: histidinol dehydrogenase [Clostridia bacterium]|jgi:histidinol dehydrogenase|nr:histidinol dehydrogenase [Clostridia bacterium]MDN5322069.1 histidinol dehydrogenase [Clostridia bacterium]